MTEAAAAHTNEPSGLKATDIGLLALRLGLGLVFVAHGSQKVLGLFGGPGLATTVQLMGKGGIPAPLAYLASFTELLGGLAVLGGLMCRLGSMGLSVVMLVAILKVHLSNGFFEQNHGFEYPFALLFMALALIFTGPGRIAICDCEMLLLGKRK